MAANLIAIGLGMFSLAAVLRPTRWLLERYLLPKPGEGPSETEQEAGFFDIRLLGKTEASTGLTIKVTGDRDPGYGSTAKMLGQAVLCLVEDIQTPKGGFWTPASLLGESLITRLQQHAGLTFSVVDD